MLACTIEFFDAGEVVPTADAGLDVVVAGAAMSDLEGGGDIRILDRSISTRNVDSYQRCERTSKRTARI